MALKRACQALLVAMGVALATLFSCGPSMQSLHESNVRFEHCYRLDLDPSIAPSHRQACWREWTERYTYGQSSDRIGYALRRAHEIGSGRPGLALNLDAGVVSDDAAAATPVAAPIHPHAPPPATAPPPKPAPDAGAATPDATVADAVPLPAADCTTSCRDALQECSGSCDAGKDRACARCERDYRSCMRRCFQ